MTSTTEQIQQLKTCFESKNYGLLMKIVEQASNHSDQRVLEELEIQIENLKNQAIKQFDQERYGDCLKAFQFLCALEPQNRNFKDYLELSRQILAEKESNQVNAGVVSAFQIYDEADLALKQPRGPGKNVPVKDPVTQPSPSPVVSVPPASSLVKPSEVKNREVSPKPDGTTRLRKRVVRVAALVAVIVLFFGMLGYWIHHVRAPHLPDQPADESNPTQVSGSGRKGLQTVQTKKVEPEAGPKVDTEAAPMVDTETGPKVEPEAGQIESPNTAAQKKPSPGNASKEYSQITEVYPVVHEHRFGSCKGQLHISRRSIRYLPFEDSGDAFKYSPSDIIGIELDGKLKMRFADRTYRFTGNSSESKQANLAELNRIYRQLIKFRQETP